MTLDARVFQLFISVYFNMEYVFGLPKITAPEGHDHTRLRRNAVLATKLENEADNILSYVLMVVFTILLLRYNGRNIRIKQGELFEAPFV